MPVSTKEKVGTRLIAQQPGDSVAGIPFKKRLLAMTRSPSPPSEVPSSLPEGSRTSVMNPIVSKSGPTISEHGTQQRFEAPIAAMTPSLGYERESLGEGDAKLDPGQEDPMFDRQGLRLGMPTSSGEVACKTEDTIVDNNSAFLKNTPSEVTVSSALPIGNVSAKQNNAARDELAFQRVSAGEVSGKENNVSSGLPGKEFDSVPTSVIISRLTGDGQHRDGLSVKQENLNDSSHGLASIEGEHSQQNKHSYLQNKADSSHNKRLNWDLNTTMDTWEGSLCSPALNHELQPGLDLINNHPRNQETGSLQKLLMDANEAEATVGKYSTLETEHYPNVSNLSMSSSKHFSSEAGLELKLRLPSTADLCPNLGVSSSLGKLNSIGKLSDLSLSLAGNLNATACSPPRSTAHSPLRPEQLGSIGVNPIIPTSIKREPCKGSFREETRKPACSNTAEIAASSNKNTDNRNAVKQEPCEQPSQQCLEKSEELLPHGQFDKHTVTPATCAPKHSNGSKDLGKLNIVLGMTSNGSKSCVTSGVVSMPKDLPLEPIASDSNRSVEMPMSGCVPHKNKGIVGGALDVVLGSTSAPEKEVNSATETNEFAAADTNGLPLKSMISDGKRFSEVTASTKSEIDKHYSVKVFGENGLEISSHGTSNTAESKGDKIVSYADASKDVFDGKELFNDNEHKLHQPSDIDTSKELAPKKGGEPGSFKNGDLRDPMLLENKGKGLVLHREGSSKEREDKQEQRGENPVHGSSDVLDIPMKMLVDEDSERKIQAHDQLKNGDSNLCTKGRDLSVSSTGNQQEVLDAAVPTASSSEKRLIKTSHKISRDQTGKEKDLETKSKSKSHDSRAVDKGHNSKMGGDLENASGCGAIPGNSLSKKDSPLKGKSVNHESGEDKHGRIIKLGSNTEMPLSGKAKSSDNRSSSALSERERMVNKSLGQSKQYSYGSRDGSYKDRFQELGSDRTKDQFTGKHGSYSMRFKMREEKYLDALHRTKNPEPEHMLERVKSSTGFQHLKHKNSSDYSVRTDGRVMRKPTRDEPLNLSHLIDRRRSPKNRGHPMLDVEVAGHPIIHPGRFIDKNIPGFLQLTAEEKPLRGWPDMPDLPLHLHPQVQYEPAEHAFIRRERSSLSPVPRRGLQMHLPRDRLRSSPGVQACSPHQWSPPRRSPNFFDGHPELVRGRSPPIIRHRSRSPQQIPCFPEDMIIRGPGSPPQFIPPITDDARGLLHLRRNGFPRPDNVMERNIQRIHMIDPQEAAEAEYFERLRYNQLYEPAGDEEFHDDRIIFDETHDFVHPRRQHFNVGGDHDRSHFSHADDSNPRPFRTRPEAVEAFPNRGRFREGNIRNRPGNARDRLRGMEGREQYHGRQRWYDADLGDARLKRRRL